MGLTESLGEKSAISCLRRLSMLKAVALGPQPMRAAKAKAAVDAPSDMPANWEECSKTTSDRAGRRLRHRPTVAARRPKIHPIATFAL